MSKTKIEWTDMVWNPVTGCSKVSEGCQNCYAEGIAKRFWAPRKFSQVRVHPERFQDPLSWRKPRRVFVDSMGDLFHEDVETLFIADIFGTMQRCPRHTFIILTKRPKRMLELLSRWDHGGALDHWPVWPLPNVWIGVSVENQKTADERIPLLLKTPAALRFVSVEPMLDSVDLTWINFEDIVLINALNGDHGFPIPHAADQNHRKLDWVICGSESGANARRFDFDWARSLRDQCNEAIVPFFFKQANIDGRLVKMPALDGVVHAEIPRENSQS